ncbi:hypothetical protein CPB84DRAFT_1763301 [Gymnopilus junonius]|uniref:U4/U6.U5 small nuclear ribonucleoprotein 27kDa protein domain-containing protein n=1 Tax=Gymnopilus junonius TaxID=109634 RepID=A0A9P5NWN0_GYMJU|nr:hypothetical protein CPB84DRAFT_1763301 [Gymnopilus junonius]
MSSRPDPRRRDRSWEREDRDRDRDRHSHGSRGGRSRGGGGSYRDEPRRRSSRSRSPRRDRDGDRRDRRERDYKHDRDDDRRDRDRDRYADDRRRDREDHRRDSQRKDDRVKPVRDDALAKDGESKDRVAPRTEPGPSSQLERANSNPTSSSRPNLDPDTPQRPAEEEGEAMDDDMNDEDAAMMGMMGMNGFGTTKGKHVVGNQIGAVNIKKVRTWRQYMNRRGGFNRPLDKIK